MENNKSGEKTCFVICPIGEEGSDIRKRSDQVLKHIIAPAIKECGYSDPIRADQMSEPGNITTQVIQSIYDADLAIADLTGHNPNVFYELSFRHAIRKPVILIIKSGETVPFDILQTRVIYLNHNDLDNADACKEEIKRHILSIENGNKQFDSPISDAMGIKAMKESGKLTEEWLAKIYEMLEFNVLLSIQSATLLGGKDLIEKALKLQHSGFKSREILFNFLSQGKS